MITREEIRTAFAALETNEEKGRVLQTTHGTRNSKSRVV